MPKLKELVLLLTIATVSGNILKDVINRIEDKASDDNLACNIAVNRQIIECSVEAKKNMVPEGTTCIFLDDYALHLEHFVCVKGFFICVDHLNKGTDVNQVRIKRYVELIVGIIGFIKLLVYGVYKLVEYLRGPKRDSVRNLPPTIECPKETTHVADKLQTTAYVELPHPRATDPENQRVSIYNVKKLKQNGERKLSKISDGTFKEGRNEMEYIAEDDVGNKASCTYILHVKVIECDSHKHVDHRRVDCNPVRTIYGSVCNFSCYTGYQLSKNSAASKTCEKTGKWSSSSDVKCISNDIYLI